MDKLSAKDIFNIEDKLTAYVHKHSDKKIGFRIQIHTSKNPSIYLINLYIDWWQRLDGKYKTTEKLKSILIDYLIDNNIKYRNYLLEPYIEVSGKDLNNLLTLWKMEGVIS